MNLQHRIEAGVLKGAMGLPERVQQLLAGKPVVIDGQTLAPETQLMLKLQKLATKPVETLPIPEGRVQLDQQSVMAGGEQPIGAVRDLDAAGIPVRLYTPRVLVGAQAPTPLLVFLHGGGFIYGGLESHDAPCRVLAEQAGVQVLAVDYRLAPEHPFPAAYDDCVAAYRWAQEHAAELNADPQRYAVGGDSAGGHLAIGVAVEAARAGLPLAFQLLIYPTTTTAHDTRSAELFSQGFFLTAGFMELATANYLPVVAERSDPRAAPALVDLPDGLAPAYLCTAGFDPLRDEGEAFARTLSEAGVEVELHRFPDQIHGFFNLTGVGRRSPAAIAQIAQALGRGLGTR